MIHRLRRTARPTALVRRLDPCVFEWMCASKASTRPLTAIPSTPSTNANRPALLAHASINSIHVSKAALPEHSICVWYVSYTDDWRTRSAFTWVQPLLRSSRASHRKDWSSWPQRLGERNGALSLSCPLLAFHTPLRAACIAFASKSNTVES